MERLQETYGDLTAATDGEEGLRASADDVSVSAACLCPGRSPFPAIQDMAQIARQVSESRGAT